MTTNILEIDLLPRAVLWADGVLRRARAREPAARQQQPGEQARGGNGAGAVLAPAGALPAPAHRPRRRRHLALPGAGALPSLVYTCVVLAFFSSLSVPLQGVSSTVKVMELGCWRMSGCSPVILERESCTSHRADMLTPLNILTSPAPVVRISELMHRIGAAR